MGAEMMVLQIDSRESNNSKIKEYFTKNNIEYFVSKLPCGDYANPQNMKIALKKRVKNYVTFYCKHWRHFCQSATKNKRKNLQRSSLNFTLNFTK